MKMNWFTEGLYNLSSWAVKGHALLTYCAFTVGSLLTILSPTIIFAFIACTVFSLILTLYHAYVEHLIYKEYMANFYKKKDDEDDNEPKDIMWG